MDFIRAQLIHSVWSIYLIGDTYTCGLQKLYKAVQQVFIARRVTLTRRCCTAEVEVPENWTGAERWDARLSVRSVNFHTSLRNCR